MISEERKVFFRWLGAGISSSSLALIVFIPNMSSGSSGLRLWSIGCFFVSIVFAVTMLFISKEIDIIAKPINRRVRGIHHTCFLVALITFLSGFSFFAISIHWGIFVAFLVSVLIGIKAWKSAQRHLASHT